MSIRARTGGGFLKFLLIVLLLAGLTVLGWGVYANWDRDRDGDGQEDGFTLHFWDPSWWSTSRDRAQPLVDYSFEMAASMKESVWGEGGLIDDVETWLAERDERDDQKPSAVTKPSVESQQRREAAEPAATPAAGSTDAPAKPVAPEKSAATRRLEEQIHTAEDLLQEGVRHYKAGVPANNGWTDQSVAALSRAQSCFTRVRGILLEKGVVEEYGRAPDRDPVLHRDAETMLRKNQELLHSVQKMGSSM